MASNQRGSKPADSLRGPMGRGAMGTDDIQRGNVGTGVQGPGDVPPSGKVDRQALARETRAGAAASARP